MHTSRGFPFVHFVALVGFAALAGVALGQVPGPATAPAAATGAPATQPVIGERALHKAVAEAQWFLGDIRSSNEVKVAACELLRRLGPGAREAAPALAAALRDEPPVRPAAVEALRAIGPDAIPALLEACDRRNRDAARLAATALLRSMPQSKDAVQGLTDQVRDAPDSSRRELAIDGLAALGPLGGRESTSTRGSPAST